MNIPVACVVVAGVMPLLGAASAKWGFKGFDNHNPRAWLAEQTGARARANAAQHNSFEAFPFFAVAVLLALHFQADAALLETLCLLFKQFCCCVASRKFSILLFSRLPSMWSIHSGK